MIFKNSKEKDIKAEMNQSVNSDDVANGAKTEEKKEDGKEPDEGKIVGDDKPEKNATEELKEKHQETAEDKLNNETEKLNKEIEELKKGQADEKDRYLRLAAEFDNFRRRTAKERLELIETASEDVIKSMLPIVDDFERAIAVLKNSKDSDAAKQGTELIYKKMMEMLKNRGVSVIEAIGKDLNTDEHEAIAQIPAKDPKQKGKIVEIAQQGYKLNGKVIRFAKVVMGN